MGAVVPGALGAVLCGGASRRMGTDKALVAVDGVPLALRVADVLRSGGCAPVVAIGGDGERLGALGMQVIVDQHPGEGPLAGIIRALEVADGACAVVVACDMPMLTPVVVGALVAALESSDGEVDVVVARSARREPLCAVWAPSARPLLEGAFEQGERAVHRAVDLLRVGELVVGDGEVCNVNTPHDLDEVVRVIGARGATASG